MAAWIAHHQDLIYHKHSKQQPKHQLLMWHSVQD